jgi:hypothetical protein
MTANILTCVWKIFIVGSLPGNVPQGFDFDVINCVQANIKQRVVSAALGTLDSVASHLVALFVDLEVVALELNLLTATQAKSDFELFEHFALLRLRYRK